MLSGQENRKDAASPDPGARLRSRKQTLRARLRTTLAALAPPARAEASARVVARVLDAHEWACAGTIALYAAMADELDLDALLAAAAGRRLCLPRLRGPALEFFQVHTLAGLETGPLGIRTPTPNRRRRVGLADIDLFLVPGLAFGRAGGRLGRGGGYYDRTLGDPARCGPAWGVGFAFQLLDEPVPSGPGDARLDAVITESGFWRVAPPGLLTQ